eukprot:658574-Rhodomonas_salina.3
MMIGGAGLAERIQGLEPSAAWMSVPPRSLARCPGGIPSRVCFQTNKQNLFALGMLYRKLPRRSACMTKR